MKPLKSYSPKEILGKVQEEVVVPPTKTLADNVAAAVEGFGLPKRMASIVALEMGKEERLRQLIEKTLSNGHDDVAESITALERAIQEMVKSICCDEEVESWGRLANKLTQRIVQDETIKRLLV